MASNLVPKGTLDRADAPEDLFINYDKLVDLRIEDPADKEIINHLNSVITPYSEFQSRAFIINNEVTDHRKIQQVALEVRARIMGTGDSHYRIKKADIEKRKLERKLATETDELERELLQLEIDKTEFDIENTKLLQYQTQLEIKKLLNLLKEIVPENTLEVLKHYKDNWEEKEEEYWTKRFGKQAMMDILMSGKIQSGNLDSIIGMPQDAQRKVIGYALLQTQKLEKGITQIAEAVRNVLISQENTETPYEIPNITGITGEYGGSVNPVTETLLEGMNRVKDSVADPAAPQLRNT